MKKHSLVSMFGLIFFLTLVPCFSQLTEEEIAARPKWEEFLLNANVAKEEQIKSQAVTNPWHLTLELDGVTNDALWKDVEGRVKGYIEGWKYEIAAYLFDKHLGLNMIPPTVEKRFHNNLGSCQLWVEAEMTLKTKVDKKIKVPNIKVFYYNRALNLQRFFDNLIGNEDRHQNNYLITSDWRIILIDHSRSFRTGKKWTSELPYGEKNKEGLVQKDMPKDIFEKMKTLTFDGIKEFVGDYLTDDEINAVLARKDLIIEHINKMVEKNGEADTLY
jgi:hypothetical protein